MAPSSIYSCSIDPILDEWYCKVDNDKYQICRKCKTLEEDCDYEAPDDCKCENMKFANTDCKLDFLMIFQQVHNTLIVGL